MSHRAAYWAIWAVKLMCAVVVVFAAIFTLFAVGPPLETRFWPVTSKLTIISLEADADGNAIITAEFTKRRDCQYLGISWYRGRPDGYFERATIVLRKAGDESGSTRPPGTQRGGPWFIGIPVDEIRTNSFAQLAYRCHPLWVTTTDFYP